MKSRFLVSFLLLGIFQTKNIFPEISKTLSRSKTGVVSTMVHFMKKYPAEATSVAVGITMACILWHNNIFQALQKAIKAVDQALNTPEETEENNYDTIDLTPYMPLLTQTPVGQQWLKEIEEQYPTDEKQRNAKIREIFVGKEIGLQQEISGQMQSTSVNLQQNPNPPESQEKPVFQQKTSATIQQQSLTINQEQKSNTTESQPLKIDTKFDLTTLFLLHNQENREAFVTELCKNDASQLLSCFLSAYKERTLNTILWCLLDALAKRLVTKEGVTQKTSIEKLLENQKERQALIEAFNYGISYLDPVDFKVFTHSARIKEIVFSPNNKFVALADDDAVLIINLQDGSIQTLPGSSRVPPVFSPDNKFLARRSREMVKIMNLQNSSIRTMTFAYTADAATNEHAVFSNDSTFVMAIASNGIVKFMNLKDGTVKTPSISGTDKIITISSDHTLIASVPAEGKTTIEIMNLQTESIKKIPYANCVCTMAFSPDNNFLAIVPKLIPVARVDILHLQNDSIKNLTHTEAIVGVHFSPDSKFLVAKVFGNIVPIMNLQDNSIKTITHDDYVTIEYLFSRDNKWIIQA